MPRCRRCPANGPSSHPVLSADGRYVAFLSSATNLTAGDHAPGAWINVYVRDTRARHDDPRSDGPAASRSATRASVDMSDDGRYVAFVSEAPNLTAGDGNSALGRLHRRPRRRTATASAATSAITRVVLGRVPRAYGMTELVISGNGEHHRVHDAALRVSGHRPRQYLDYLYRGCARGRRGARAPRSIGSVSPTTSSPRSTATARSSSSSPTDRLRQPDTGIIASTYDLGRHLLRRRRSRRTSSSSARGRSPLPRCRPTAARSAWADDPAPGSTFAGIAPRSRRRSSAWRPSPGRTRPRGIACSATTRRGRASTSATGDAPSLSASGRTVAFSGPPPWRPARRPPRSPSTRTRTRGSRSRASRASSSTSGYMAIVDIAKIPVSALRGYAAALANAPIHRLPIHRLPIHRLPIYRLPIHRLLIEDSPIHRLPIHRPPDPPAPDPPARHPGRLAGAARGHPVRGRPRCRA